MELILVARDDVPCGTAMAHPTTLARLSSADAPFRRLVVTFGPPDRRIGVVAVPNAAVGHQELQLCSAVAAWFGGAGTTASVHAPCGAPLPTAFVESRAVRLTVAEFSGLTG